MNRQNNVLIEGRQQAQWTGFEAIDGGVSGLALFKDSRRAMAYFYLPLSITPQLQSDGRPMFNLLPFDEGGFLSFNVRWKASDEQLAAVRANLAEQQALERPDELMLSFAPLNQLSLNLYLELQDGSKALLASTNSTGAPPYSSLFNLKLDSQQFSQVAEVVQGASGLLSIELQSEWLDELQLEGRLCGALSLQSLYSAGQPDPIQILDFLTTELGAGRLALNMPVELADDSIEYRAFREQIIDQAVQALATAKPAAGGSEQANFSLSINYQQTMSIPRPVSFVTDLADWFRPPGRAESNVI